MKGPRIVKRKAINTETDPYLHRIKPGDMAACKKCGAVYHNKRWSLTVPAGAGGKAQVPVVCPACRKVMDRFAEGFVTIRGRFLDAHKEEILRLIRNKEKVAMRYNPLDRIIGINEKKGLMDITTTTEKMAQRIGQMMKKTFDGELTYKWSDDVKLARVVWTREEPPEGKR
ncbi:MAG: ATPase [Deltaproteobacteria bacterium]|nr:ATPase [Deltaproteobacteria bacterium]